MELIIDKRAINFNLNKAKALAKTSAISVLLKSFYEYLDPVIPDGILRFSKNLKGSICYSLNSANKDHEGALISNLGSFQLFKALGIKKFYIPVNGNDNREGLCYSEAYELARIIKSEECKVYALITGGCMNEKHLKKYELIFLWDSIKNAFDGLSIGGSYYLQKDIPEFVNDVRIGEYMLFGTIPYCENYSLFGINALSLDLYVIGKYLERNQIIVRGGYEHYEPRESKIISPGLRLVDCSSEYTIYEDPLNIYSLGSKISVIPSYKSLIKLQYVERKYKE